MDIDIDFATAADLEPMADLLAELFTLESDFRPARDKQVRGLRLILEQPQIGRLFVLRSGGAVVGMANALITVSTAEGRPVLLLEDVIINAAHRGRRLGRRLVEHVLAWAAGAGMSRVTLLADRNNAPALAYYERLGFAPSAMTVWRKNLA
ncbi:MAG: GNAT family N-acetyltransferase [Rhodocyclaceae bacterium]|nr:GNAT family N-acetyltransferase [Rhodocyclaceae bacterium]